MGGGGEGADRARKGAGDDDDQAERDEHGQATDLDCGESKIRNFCIHGGKRVEIDLNGAFEWGVGIEDAVDDVVTAVVDGDGEVAAGLTALLKRLTYEAGEVGFFFVGNGGGDDLIVDPDAAEDLAVFEAASFLEESAFVEGGEGESENESAEEGVVGGSDGSDEDFADLLTGFAGDFDEFVANFLMGEEVREGSGAEVQEGFGLAGAVGCDGAVWVGGFGQGAAGGVEEGEEEGGIRVGGCRGVVFCWSEGGVCVYLWAVG